MTVEEIEERVSKKIKTCSDNNLLSNDLQVHTLEEQTMGADWREALSKEFTNAYCISNTFTSIHVLSFHKLEVWVRFNNVFGFFGWSFWLCSRARGSGQNS